MPDKSGEAHVHVEPMLKALHQELFERQEFPMLNESIIWMSKGILKSTENDSAWHLPFSYQSWSRFKLKDFQLNRIFLTT